MRLSTSFAILVLAASLGPVWAAPAAAPTDSYDYWYNRGAGEWKGMEDEAAVKSLTRALEFKPNDARALAERARAYKNLDRNDLAKADLLKVVEVCGRLKNKTVAGSFESNAAIDLSSIYAKEGNYDKAIALLDLAYKQSADTIALIAKAELLCKKKDYAAGLNAVNESIKVRPRYIRCFECKGNCLAGLGKWKEAEVAYSQALALTGEDKKNRGPRERWRILNERAKVYTAMGKPELAARDTAAQSGDRDSFIELAPFRSATGKGLKTPSVEK